MVLRIHNWAEIGAALVCTICLLYKPSVLNRWFVLFLWITTVVELIGKTLGFAKLFNEKMLMYNLFSAAEFFFYLFFLLTMSEIRKLKIMILGSIIIFGVFFLINLLFIEGVYKYNQDTYVVGSILIILSGLVFLHEVSVSETKRFGAYRWIFLIIISALLIYYVGNIFHVAVKKYLDKSNPLFSSSLYAAINHNLNLVLYSLFSIAFFMEVKMKRS